MKSFRYYLKSSNKLIAMTRYKDLADEFELIYDMDKIRKEVDYWEDDKEYSKVYGNLTRSKLWYYTLKSSDGKIVVCLTDEMNDAIEKAVHNIQYTLKSAALYSKYLTTNDVDIPKEYLEAFGYMSQNSNVRIDTYRIWKNLYCDIIKITDTKEAKESSINAARLLGVYKYNYNQSYLV